MSEQKPYKFTIKRTDGSEEVIEADESVIASAPAWVFKQDGQVVRRVLQDEVSGEPSPSFHPTPQEAAEWSRVKAQLEAKNPKVRRQHPRR